jgi:aryl-alcohol dehydrogenase-like predicted oxidoreductase
MRRDERLIEGVTMDQIAIGTSGLHTSRIGLGTWAIGGWMWGGTDEAQSIATIRSAVERGVMLIDTAPVYGFGRSEEIVGKALAEGGLRDQVQIATKMGLEWKGGAAFRDSRPTRIRREIEDSLRRLRTDVVDLYQVHWPDLETDDNRATRWKALVTWVRDALVAAQPEHMTNLRVREVCAAVR